MPKLPPPLYLLFTSILRIHSARASTLPSHLPAQARQGFYGRAQPQLQQQRKNEMEEDELANRVQDRVSAKGKGRSGGGGRRGSGNRGGGRSTDVDLSRALSRLLRHQAENAGIRLDDGGFAPLDRVLQWGPLRTISPTFTTIQSLITTNDKQRFSMKPNPKTNPSLDESTTDPSHWLIRANQGHSIKLDSSGLLQPLTLEAANIPETVVHGTYFAFWPAIVSSGGLKKMGRNHVHCSTGVPEDERGVVSGMRRDAELLVFVDVRRSLQDKAMSWWVSDNGVVLTEGDGDGLVPLKYFREVVGRKGDVGILWRDGERVADLPEGIRARVPLGKEMAEKRDRGEGEGGRGRGRGRGRG